MPFADTEWIELSEDVRAPREFLIRIEEPAYYCQIEARLGLYGKPECSAITLRMNDGSAINWEVLRRVPLDDWLTGGLTHCLWEFRKDLSTPTWVPVGELPSSDFRNSILERLRREVIDRGGSRRPLTKGLLLTVAKSYRAAVMTGKPPIKALQEVFPQHSRSTINKWVKRARNEGLLEPANYNRRKKKGAPDGLAPGTPKNKANPRRARPT